MELVIHKPTEFIQEITFNHEELKQELELRLKKYEDITYTEDEVKIAKSDRADLNRFKTAIEDKRKSIKNECLTPYNKFEEQIKEIVSLVEKPILLIDTQIKKYEDDYKNEKKIIIEQFFKENIGHLKDLVKLELFWNEKWMNKTYSLTTISKEIEDSIKKATEGIKAIQEFNSKFQSEMINKFLTPDLFKMGISMTEAMATKVKLEKQEQQVEALRQKQQTEKELADKQKEVRQQQSAQIQKQVQEIQVQSRPEPQAFQQQEQKLEQIDFRCWVTEEQKVSLRNFIIQNKIKVGKVR